MVSPPFSPNRSAPCHELCIWRISPMRSGEAASISTTTSKRARCAGACFRARYALWPLGVARNATVEAVFAEDAILAHWRLQPLEQTTLHMTCRHQPPGPAINLGEEQQEAGRARRCERDARKAIDLARLLWTYRRIILAPLRAFHCRLRTHYPLTFLAACAAISNLRIP